MPTLEQALQRLNQLRGRDDFAQIAERLLSRAEKPPLEPTELDARLTVSPSAVLPPEPEEPAPSRAALVIERALLARPEMEPFSMPQGLATTAQPSPVRGSASSEIEFLGVSPRRARSFLDAFRSAISGQESRDRDDALGIELGPESMHQGDRAAGRFQIMPQTAQTLARSFPSVEARLANALGMSAQDAPTSAITEAIRTNPGLSSELMDANVAFNAREIGSTDPQALALAHYAGPGAARTFVKTGFISDKPVRHGNKVFPSPKQYVEQILARFTQDIDSPTLGELLLLLDASISQ